MTRDAASGPPQTGARDAGATAAPEDLKGSHRRHRRFRTQSLRIDNPVVGRVVNVGQQGLAVESPDSLAVGQTYIFKVRLGEKHMRLAGRIQWCRLTATRAKGEEESRPIYKAGVALVETVTSKAWQEALRRVTEESAYVIWHRARRNGSEPGADDAASPGADDLQQAGPAAF